MALEPKRAAMAAFMLGLCILFIILVLYTRVGTEMFVVLSSILMFVMAILLIVWGVVQFRRRRKD
jgi:cytochrome c biogenesis protein CcdA